MADHQDLSPRSDETDSVACERAVFTSLPSATGEGYRLAAASPGLKSDERIEITRRSPSHDSLCSRVQGAAGIAVYALESGRISVSLARYAGAEHTQRGGGRVWTDIVVSDAPGYVRLGAHPDAFCRAAIASPTLKPLSQVLTPLMVSPWRDSSVASGPPTWDGATVAGLAAILHGRRASVAAAGKSSASALVWALYMLPAFARRGLNCSGGLRLSRMRQINCTIIDDLDQDTLRATRGHGITCYTASEARRQVAEPLRGWLALASRWWDEGRAGDIVRISCALHGSLGDVAEVAAMCEAVDRREREPAELEWLLAKRVAA